MNTDTIAAIASGLTPAGIGIIRISGPQALRTADKVMRRSGENSLEKTPSHTARYGRAYGADGGVIDEALALVMKAPHSYTGEDVAELQCHGGPYVMKRLLDRVLECGARAAEPGEFTKRAFLNGRLDLSQAEAVMELIEAENETARRSAAEALQGSLGADIRQVRAGLLYETAYLEAALDDPEHITLEGYGERLGAALDQAQERLERLLSRADEGRVLTEGIRTVILGRPNAGKSTLLNMFSGRERAIVTDTPGTTRDTLEERVRLGELLLLLTDTAGLRETADRIEELGVRRAYEAAEGADLIIYVVDGTEPPSAEDAGRIAAFAGRNLILLINKADGELACEAREFTRVLGREGLVFSAKEETGRPELESAIKDMFYRGELASERGLVIANARQKEALSSALASLGNVRATMEAGLPEDLYTVDLMAAYTTLGMITGESVSEDLVDEIFSKFCMGK